MADGGAHRPLSPERAAVSAPRHDANVPVPRPRPALLRRPPSGVAGRLLAASVLLAVAGPATAQVGKFAVALSAEPAGPGAVSTTVEARALLDVPDAFVVVHAGLDPDHPGLRGRAAMEAGDVVWSGALAEGDVVRRTVRVRVEPDSLYKTVAFALEEGGGGGSGAVYYGVVGGQFVSEPNRARIRRAEVLALVEAQFGPGADEATVAAGSPRLYWRLTNGYTTRIPSDRVLNAEAQQALVRAGRTQAPPPVDAVEPESPGIRVKPGTMSRPIPDSLQYAPDPSWTEAERRTQYRAWALRLVEWWRANGWVEEDD